MQAPPRTPPRLYCVPATAAPVVAVFRRGPSAWAHLGRWDLAAERYEPGAWLRARVFPRRSDLSPDGRWLLYFAHKPAATWGHGEAYVALSRLPWLTALHAFGTCGTWTRGYHFTTGSGSEGEGDPEGAALPIPFGLRATRPEQFATERRRGWEEAPDSPPRRAGDGWDQTRNARLRKPRPGGGATLRVESLGWAGGEFGVGQAVDGLRVRYSLEAGSEVTRLDDVQWTDWDAAGRLLVATRAGALQVRDADADPPGVLWEADLAPLAPRPEPAPAWAARW